MRTFKDAEGREWKVSVNIATVKRVKSLVEVDLLEAADGKLMYELSEDPIKLVDTIYAICKTQADERGITDEQFGEAMLGDVISDANDALLEELCDFFPGPKRRILRKVLKKVQKVQTRGIEMAEKELDDPMMDKKIEEIMSKAMTKAKKTHGLSSGGKQGK